MGLFDRFKAKRNENQNNQPENNTDEINEKDKSVEEVNQEMPELSSINAESANQETGEATKNKTGFLERFKIGLSKTRQNISGKIDGLIKKSSKLDEEFYEELEEILIQADVGVTTSIKLVDEIRTAVKKRKISSPQEINELIKEEINNILSSQSNSLNLTTDKLTVIMVVGVNGAGKTTSIGKLAYRFKSEGKKVLLAAGDTFRAAAIDQLQVWADRVGVDLIKHQEGSDPGAVVFDALQAAAARKADILIVDTAGRLQNKTNLMKEIAKLKKIVSREIEGAPQEVLLVLDATTGQNAISQAKQFAEATGLTGIILTKLDGTAKGGIVIAIANELSIPVKLIGIGEGIEDLRDFSAESFAGALFND